MVTTELSILSLHLALWPQESLYCSSLSLQGTVRLRGAHHFVDAPPFQHSPPNLRHIDSGEEPGIKEKNSL